MSPLLKWTAAAAGVLGLGLAAFFYLSAPYNHVVLLESAARRDSMGTRYVTGTLRNQTNRTYVTAEVTIHFLGREGRVLDSITIRRTAFPGQNEWHIRTPVPTPEAVQYRFQRLTCWPSRDASDWEVRRACRIPAESRRAPYVGDLPVALSS